MDAMALRLRIKQLERDKDDMIESFEMTTQVLLERIRGLEAQVGTSTRPGT